MTTYVGKFDYYDPDDPDNRNDLRDLQAQLGIGPFRPYYFPNYLGEICMEPIPFCASAIAIPEDYGVYED